MDPIPAHGYVAFRVLGVPFLFHWSFPVAGIGIGLAIASLFVTTSLSLSVQVFLWTTSAVVILVVAHEIGHAVAARIVSLRVVAIVIAHVGGRCFVDPPPPPRADLVLSAGGVLMQLALFAVTVTALWAIGAPTTLALKCVVLVLTGGNIVLMVINLLPYGGSDGARMVNAVRALWVAART
jgi:Zn-dependent protease